MVKAKINTDADIMSVEKDGAIVFRIDCDGVCHVNGKTVFLDSELIAALRDMVYIVTAKGGNNEHKG